MQRTALYAAVGARLTHYDIDVDAAALSERGGVSLPVGVQYAWRHRTAPFLYVACSDGGLGEAGTRHCLCALRIAPDGALTPHGEPVPLEWRPLHLTVDRDSRHVLVAYNEPSTVTVFHIAADGGIGPVVAQPPWPALRPTAHQVLVSPDNDRVLLPVRGNDAKGNRPEDPGGIEVFDYRNGVLTHSQTVAPNGGFGFGPRHIAFHPTRPWMYLSIERQNEIALLELGARVEGPRFRTTTLLKPHDEKPRQLGGAIHVHPNGRFAYVSNRADGTVDDGGRPVFNGGENTIAVFALDPSTGAPSLVQAEDTRGIHVRTFHIHPSGRLLVAGNMRSRNVRDGATVRAVPGGLSVFRIADDGTLHFTNKYDADVSKANLFWTGMVALPEAKDTP